MKKEKIRDMTSGNCVKLILAFTIPLVIGNVFQQFYSMVDTIIVGRFISMDALAAVGSTGPINFLILGFTIGVANGFCVIAAQRFGAENYDGMRKAVTMSTYLCALLTIVITALSLLLAKPLLHATNTPENIFQDAYTYIAIIFAGTGAALFYNLISSVLRALGDSKTPLYFLIVSSVINVALDLICIINFHMGVAGAAVATIFSQGVSFVLCYFYMRKKFEILRFTKEDWRIDWRMIRSLLKIGIPAGLQYCVTAIGIVVLQGAINSFGSVTVAAFTSASKVEQLATQPMMSLGIAVCTFVGQNIGANQLSRVREGVRKSALISVAFCVLAGAMVFLFGHQLVQIFVTENNDQLFRDAKTYLNTVSLCFPVLGLLFIYRYSLQGLGNAVLPMLAGAMELIMRVVAALFLAGIVGYFGVCVAGPIAWFAAAVLLFISFYILVRRAAKRARMRSISRPEPAARS